MSNLLLTIALDDHSFFKVSMQSLFKLDHLYIMGSIVYILIYEEEKKTKSIKWELKRIKRMLVVYDSHTINYIYLYDKENVIYIKDLKIVNNVDEKANSQFTSYNAIIAVQGKITGNIPILYPHTPQNSFLSPYI